MTNPLNGTGPISPLGNKDTGEGLFCDRVKVKIERSNAFHPKMRRPLERHYIMEDVGEGYSKMLASFLITVLRLLRQSPALSMADGLTDGELLRRFVAGRDKAAFEVLVGRHGPMVLGLCRRLLSDPADAEDAFQATFLVLVHKAATIAKQGSVASWLYGVAYRLARRLKADEAMRRKHETKLLTHPIEEIDSATSWNELRPVIDEELNRLPEKYRVPVLLCYLNGMTYDRAAGELGWSKGTLSTRLTRARELLRERLTARGVALSVGTLTAALAAVPPALADLTLKAAGASVLAGEISSPRVEGLVRALVRSMLMTKLKWAGIVVLAMVVIAGGLAVLPGWGVLPSFTQAKDQEPPPEKPDTPQRKQEKDDPLPHGALARMGTHRWRHGNVVECVAFAPDGKALASGSWDGTVRLWDARTGAKLWQTDSQTQCVYSLSFSADGKELAGLVAGLPGNPAPVWDVATGKELRRWESWTVNTRCLVHAPDGKGLLAAATTWDDKDTSILLMDVATKKELRKLEGHKEKVIGVAFSQDGKTLGSASTDDTVRLWDTTTGRELLQVKVPIKEKGEIVSLSFSPDQKSVIMSLPDQSLRLYDAATGRELRNLGGHVIRRALTFAPDGETFAGGGEDHAIRLWNAEDGKEIRPFGGHSRAVRALALSPDGQTLITAGADASVRFWQTATGKERLCLDWPGYVTALALSPDGRNLVLALSDHFPHLRLVDPGTGRELRQFDGHKEAVTTLAFAPDGKTLASGSGDKTVRLWDIATGHQIGEALDLKGGAIWVGFSPDGKVLATLAWEIENGNADRRLRLWEIATRKERSDVLPVTLQSVESVALSPDGRTLAAALPDNTLRVCDLTTGLELRKIPRDPSRANWANENQRVHMVLGSPMRSRGECLLFSPDGRTLICPEQWNRVLVYEVATGKVRRELDGHMAAVSALALSADGRLASGSRDATALMWDPAIRASRRQEADKPAKVLQYWWDSLAEDTHEGGLLALLTLAALPRQTVPLLKERLRPVPRFERNHVERLIADLDSETFTVREKAARELAALERAAESTLRKALEGKPSAEVRRRIEGLLEKCEPDFMSGDRLQATRALEVLEAFGTSEALALLKDLAEGAPEAWLTREAQISRDRLTKRFKP